MSLRIRDAIRTLSQAASEVGNSIEKAAKDMESSVRSELDRTSDHFDATAGVDRPGPMPITLTGVKDSDFAHMEAEVAKIEQREKPLSAKERKALEAGKILSRTTTLPDGSVEELTQGVVGLPLEEFLKKMPIKDWGKNLSDWKGGEVRPAGPDRQIERMVMRMPGRDLDMTKVESLNEKTGADGKLESSTVRWEVLKSDNDTVIQDSGTLRLERFGDKTLVTWHSAHKLNKFRVLSAVLPKPVTNAGTGVVLSDFFKRQVEHYRGLAAR